MYNRVCEESAHFLLAGTGIDVGVASPGELNGIIVLALTDTVTHSAWIWTQKTKMFIFQVHLKYKGKTLWSKLVLQLGKVDMCLKSSFSHVTRY